MMIIRPEKEFDIDMIFEITEEAFRNHPISKHTEQFIVNALRDAGALTISLVAEIEGRTVGHIAFSPVEISDGSSDWYGLGPVSVKPALQRQGIGTALINEGLLQLKSLGAKGCVLVGPPEYYQRFGFKSLPDLNMKGVPQQYVQALPFDENRAAGFIFHHRAFSATG